MKVWIVGAGPGDPELITLKGRRLLAEADLVVYAGSLVNPELLEFARPGIPVFDSATMTLEEVLALYDERRLLDGTIVRLHTGDPSIYGAIQEQIDHCEAAGMPVEVVPGVSSVFAAAASLRREFTLPGVSQSLIITRAAGRTPVPDSESLASFATHRTSMALFLSGSLLPEAAGELLSSYPPQTPLRMVRRASWPDEEKLSCSLSELAAGAVEFSGGKEGQIMVLLGPALAPTTAYDRSKLYDPSFTHGRRRGSEDGA
jgi:precorrin-4/cobalt-precorrin-4 C11-methyltransferase